MRTVAFRSGSSTVCKAIVAFTLCLSADAYADPITFQYATGSFFQDNIGNTGFPGGFDRLTLNGISDTLTLQPGETAIAVLNSFSFDVGITGFSPPVPNPVALSLTRSLTIDSTTAALIQNAEVTIDFLPVADALTIFQGPPLDLTLGANRVRITPVSVSTVTSGLGTVNGVINGQFEVTPIPEPASFILIGAGLLGIVAQRRLGPKVSVPGEPELRSPLCFRRGG